MNKLLKGAVAGAAGIALLLGGAGTFAAWNDRAGVTGSSILTGTLSVDGSTNGTWAWDAFDTNPTAANQVNAASDRIVPGDVVYYNADVTVHAAGKHLKGQFTVSGGSLKGVVGGDDNATAVVSVQTSANVVSNNGVYDITPNANGSDIVVPVSVAITFKGAPGSSDTANSNQTNQGKTFTLTDLAIDLTQQP